MTVNRFLKVLVLLVAGLLVLMAGLDHTLDRINRTGEQGNFTFYNDKGAVLYDYRGDLAYCTAYDKPMAAKPGHGASRPASSVEPTLRWF